MEDLFGAYFLSTRDTDVAFRNINKNALLKVVKGYKDFLNDSDHMPSLPLNELSSEKYELHLENIYCLQIRKSE